MNAIQAVQTVSPPGQKPFSELLAHCEIRAIASRIAAAVAHFFTAIARFICSCFQSREQRAIQAIPKQQRADVLAHARTIIESLQVKYKMAMSDRTKAAVIHAMARIPVEERTTFIPMIRERVQFFDNLVDIRLDAFVTEVVNKNVLEKMQAIEYASLICNLQDSYWISVFKAIAMIPPNERNHVIELALQFKGGELAPLNGAHLPWYVERFIEALAVIPADERDNVVFHAMQLITPEMHIDGVTMMMQDVAEVPADERAQYVADRLAGIHQNHNAVDGVNVHEGNRDQRVNAAIELLRRHQGEISPEKIQQATNEFIKYLEVFPMDAAQKQLATDALLKPSGEEGFGPLLKGEGFAVLGLPITGEEVIGRLWIFASQLKEEEQANAKRGMISALQNSYENEARVCNQGKTQRLIVAVLQGRLKDVDIDGVNIPKQISKADAMQLFFTPDRREINVKTVLLQAANKFCDENPGIDRQEFLVEINAYAAQAEMPET